MSKTVEFHQATITVVVRVVDEDQSYGSHNFQIDLLVDTDKEWELARESIEKQIKQMQEQLNNA